MLWAFEPPLSSDNVTLPSQDTNDGRGIWITDVRDQDRPTSTGEVSSEDEEDESGDSELEEEAEGSGDEDNSGEDHVEDEDDADESEEEHPSQGQTLRFGGKFGALSLEEDDSDS